MDIICISLLILKLCWLHFCMYHKVRNTQYSQFRLGMRFNFVLLILWFSVMVDLIFTSSVDDWRFVFWKLYLHCVVMGNCSFQNLGSTFVITTCSPILAQTKVDELLSFVYTSSLFPTSSLHVLCFTCLSLWMDSIGLILLRGVMACRAFWKNCKLQFFQNL